MNAIQRLLTDHIDIWTAAETETKSGRGRTSSAARSVYGVKKLRELILELAVRGKLVPQDANDEPASELLKRIQIKENKLATQGKIKNSKLLDQEISEKMPFTLPTGWAYSRLGNVVDIIRGITFPGSEKTKTPGDGRVACLRTANVQDQIEWHDILYIREEFVSRDDQILMPRDIVMSMANSRELVGKVALVDSTIHQRTSFGGFLGVLRPYLIEPRFVMALLRTPHIREALIDSASQTTNIANISLAKLRPLLLAIPPLEEQHRIVAKVDEMMALCDQLEAQHIDAADAHEQLVSHLLGALTQSRNAEDFGNNWQRIAAIFDTLFTTEASIDALKQTLLQLAVMGKLVAQDANDESASELLKNIRAKKALLVAEGKIKKDKLFAPISSDERPFDIPESWCWVRFGEISNIKSELVRPEDFQDFRQIAPDCIEKGTGLLTESRTVKEAEIKGPNSRFYKGQIVYSKIRPSLSKAVLVDFDGLCSADMYPMDIFIDSKFMLKEILSECFLEQVRLAENRIKMPKLNQESLTAFILPLPPLAEQIRIVKKIDELMILCDGLKSRISMASQQQKKLADVFVGNTESPRVL